MSLLSLSFCAKQHNSDALVLSKALAHDYLPSIRSVRRSPQRPGLRWCVFVHVCSFGLVEYYRTKSDTFWRYLDRSNHWCFTSLSAALPGPEKTPPGCGTQVAAWPPAGERVARPLISSFPFLVVCWRQSETTYGTLFVSLLRILLIRAFGGTLVAPFPDF